MTKVEILAMSPGVPRAALATEAPGSESDARALLERIFPGRIGTSLASADLLAACYPEYGRIYAGRFGDTDVVCGQDLIELADLAAALEPLSAGRTIVRLQINSMIESSALEILGPDGSSVREVMLVAEEGVVFDIGPHLEFEQPFWAGRRDPDNSFLELNGSEMPFDAIAFGEEALRTLFGFAIDAETADGAAAHGAAADGAAADGAAADGAGADGAGAAARTGDLDPRAVRLHGFVIAADSADPADLAAARSAPLTLRPGDIPEAEGFAGTRGSIGGRIPATADPVGAQETATAAASRSSATWWDRFTRFLTGRS